jgi:hypothetical protein
MLSTSLYRNSASYAHELGETFFAAIGELFANNAQAGLLR